MEIWDEEGWIIPAPTEALEKYEDLKIWLNTQPNLPNEKQVIALYPVYKGEKKGYMVATQVVYKP